MRRQFAMVMVGTVLIVGSLAFSLRGTQGQAPQANPNPPTDNPAKDVDLPSATVNAANILEKNSSLSRKPKRDSNRSRPTLGGGPAGDMIEPGPVDRPRSSDNSSYGGVGGSQAPGSLPLGTTLNSGTPSEGLPGLPGMEGGMGMAGGPGMGSGMIGGGLSMPGGMMGMPGGMISEHVQAEQRLAYETRQIMDRYSNSEDESEKQKLIGKLAETVEQHFDLRQAIREKEIKALEAQVKKLRELHDRRNSERDRIVSDRVDLLLRDANGLGWGENVSQPGLGRFPGAPVPTGGFLGTLGSPYGEGNPFGGGSPYGGGFPGSAGGGLPGELPTSMDQSQLSGAGGNVPSNLPPLPNPIPR